MKKEIIVTIFVCFLIIQPVVIVGKTTNVSNVNKEYVFSENTKTNSNSENHTVLVEYASLTTDSLCPTVTDQPYNIYKSGNYNFYYVTLVADKNKIAEKRVQELGVTSYPDVYFDGGYMHVSGVQNNVDTYINALSSCSNREVSSIDVDLEVSWSQCPCQQDATIRINIYNKENNTYDGHLLIYITEGDSRWKDYSGRLYSYAVIGCAANESISLKPSPKGHFYSDYIWDPVREGFPEIDVPNIMVIACVFSESTGFADKTVASRPTGGAQPMKPDTPVGKINGKIGKTYVYTTSTTDPDGDKIRYGWDWDGDYIVDEWTGYYNSGEEVNSSHIWVKKGDYMVQVKAKDANGLDSFWSDMLPVIIPRNKNMLTSYIHLSDRLLQRLHMLAGMIARINETIYD